MKKKMTTCGLVLRAMPLGESDRLVTLLTKSEGLVRAFARRANNLGDSKNSATSLLCYSRFNLFRNGERYIISDAIPIEAFFGLRSDITLLALAQYLAQLIEELAPEPDTAGDCLRVALNSLHFLCSGARPAELIKALAELRLLAVSGFMPDIVGCASCGAYESPVMFFHADGGTLLCKDCRTPDAPPAVALSPLALAAMRHIVYSPLEKAFAVNLTGTPLREAASAAEAYLLKVLPRDFTTLGFYKSLTQKQ